MTDSSFTCTNCRTELIVDENQVDSEIKCHNCGIDSLIVPIFKTKVPEIPVDVRAAFIGILAIVALIGGLGACMLMGRWNFWVTFALIAGMIFLIERIFLNRYHLTKIEEFIEQEIRHVYIQSYGERFNELVNEAIAELPDKFKIYLKEINIVVEDVPGDDVVTKLRLASNRSLAGLYQGVPLTKRSVWHGSRMADKITIYKKNVESYCATDAALKREIKRVVRHELGHFFGFDEEQLRRIEKENEN